MSDYTIEELEKMLADKQEEFVSQDPRSALDIFTDDVGMASDVEVEKIMSGSIIVGFIHKSQTENKQYTEQRLYINETENGQIVGRAVTGVNYITGSYSDTLATPTLQIVGTRAKDRTVLKGEG